jgi:hypothetical protein
MAWPEDLSSWVGRMLQSYSAVLLTPQYVSARGKALPCTPAGKLDSWPEPLEDLLTFIRTPKPTLRFHRRFLSLWRTLRMSALRVSVSRTSLL